MKTAFEEELSDALAHRAAAVPRGAAERLRAIDYHPRHHRLPVPVAVGTGAAAGAATVGTVLAVVLGGATPAFAGWSAIPSSAAPTSAAAPDCLSTLTSAAAGQAGTSSGGTWQTLLSDVRGPFTITLLQNGSSYATCFSGPSFIEVNRITSATLAAGSASSGELTITGQGANGGHNTAQGGLGSLVSLEGTASGDLTQVLQNHLTTSSDGPYTFIDGRVANGVTGVTLSLDDGQSVVSTVADGWFVAWWPGSTADATSAQVTKASGTTSEPFVPVSHEGLKMPLGAAPTPGQPLAGVPPTLSPGSCTSTTTSTTATSASGGASVNCKSTSSNGSNAPSVSNSGSSGNSGNSGSKSSTANSGITGSGPTTKSNP